jgi:hypothetical protein
VDPRRNGYSRAQTSTLIRRSHDDLRASPATEAAAVSRIQLLTGGTSSRSMTIQADRRLTSDRDVNVNAITPGFFATLGIRIVAGRDYDERDSTPVGTSGPRSAIVNETFVKRYLAGYNPLGARVGSGSGPDVQPDIEIVGVVADFSYRGIREEWEQVYFPMLDAREDSGHFYVRVRGTSDQAAQSLRAIVHDADPALPITYFRTVNEQVDRSLNTERMLAALSRVLAGWHSCCLWSGCTA